uniref:Uncharacterized protein n=1 Tax=Lactuca sativa TaxID=4236 RepID=A0A9R1WYH7_LACSA|nr:hypothetical protein LSAT_V11C800404430 [Lactuca sativa]
MDSGKYIFGSPESNQELAVVSLNSTIFGCNLKVHNCETKSTGGEHMKISRLELQEASLQLLMFSLSIGGWGMETSSGQLLNADKWLLLFNQRSSSYKTFDIWFFKVCEAKKVEHETHLERKTI